MKYTLRWLDLLLALVLFVIAFLPRWAGTRGDLWLDEADYALASRHGFQMNRLDRTDVPAEPDRLVRLRHYHPPAVVYMILVARSVGTADRVLRLPFVIIGCLTVTLVYLCGLALFAGSRPTAFGCSVLLAFTPPDIRAASHALPWSLIVCCLSLLLWTLLSYLGTRRVGWLAASGGALGLLFVSSEYFFPALLVAAGAAPIMFAADWKDVEQRQRILRGVCAGLGLWMLISLTLWPAGLAGDALRMLRHYVTMAGDSWPVEILGHRYRRAPKWAYLYWCLRYYPVFFVCYLLGAFELTRQALRREIAPETLLLLLFVCWALLVVHRAHIIGPAYLVPVLPFMTLIAGLFFLKLMRRWPAPGNGGMVFACLAAALMPVRWDPLNMDRRSLVSRWPRAAKFLAARWKPGDMMLAPSFGDPARWYLLDATGGRMREWQVQALPDSDDLKLLHEIASGSYRYIAVGSAFDDVPAVGARISDMVRRWPRIWISSEDGSGTSRLVIYERPYGVSRHRPLPIPSRPGSDHAESNNL